MAVLSKDDIWHRITKDQADPLIITPLLDPLQVGGASVDIRLGHQFITLKRAAVTHVDPTNHEQLSLNLHRTQHRIRVGLNEPFVIHPGQLVLGASLEYISMPKDLAATVEGRSSWGRLGLIIATACSVAPGFKGCITLELVNDGEVPLVLYPGVRIAQLVLQKTDKKSDYREESASKYDCPTGPEFSRIHKDPEMKLWGSRLGSQANS